MLKTILLFRKDLVPSSVNEKASDIMVSSFQLGVQEYRSADIITFKNDDGISRHLKIRESEEALKFISGHPLITRDLT